MARIPTWPVAALGLIAGFGVAVATGVRPLGGLVLAAATIWCALQWLALGRRTTAALVGTVLVAFALAHVLGLAIGAWPAVFAVAAATAVITWRLADQRLDPTA